MIRTRIIIVLFTAIVISACKSENETKHFPEETIVESIDTLKVTFEKPAYILIEGIASNPKSEIKLSKMNGDTIRHSDLIVHTLDNVIIVQASRSDFKESYFTVEINGMKKWFTVFNGVNEHSNTYDRRGANNEVLTESKSLGYNDTLKIPFSEGIKYFLGSEDIGVSFDVENESLQETIDIIPLKELFSETTILLQDKEMTKVILVSSK